MSVIRWEEPPNRAAQMADKWADAAAELRSHPRLWAVLLEGNSTQCSTLVNYVKRGGGPFAPAGAFEALSRTTRKGGTTVAVYARFVDEREVTS